MIDTDPFQVHSTKSSFNQNENNNSSQQIITPLMLDENMHDQNISERSLLESPNPSQRSQENHLTSQSGQIEQSKVQMNESSFQIESSVEKQQNTKKISQIQRFLTKTEGNLVERIIPETLRELSQLPNFSMDIAKKGIQSLKQLFVRYGLHHIKQIQSLMEKFKSGQLLLQTDLLNLQATLQERVFGLDFVQLLKRQKQLKNNSVKKYNEVIILDGPEATGKTTILAGLAGLDIEYFPNSAKSHHQVKIKQYREKYNIKRNQTYTHFNKSKISRNYSKDLVAVFDITIANYETKNLSPGLVKIGEEIANVLNINQELSKIQKLRFVIVLSAGYFGDRTKVPFQKLIRNYAKVFEKIPQIKERFIVILTKGLKVADLIDKVQLFLKEANKMLFSDREVDFIQKFKNTLYSYRSLIEQRSQSSHEETAVMEIDDPSTHKFDKLVEFILSEKSVEVDFRQNFIELHPLCQEGKQLYQQYLLKMCQKTFQRGDFPSTEHYLAQFYQFKRLFPTTTTADIKSLLKQSMMQNKIMEEKGYKHCFYRLIEIKNLLSLIIPRIKNFQILMNTIVSNNQQFERLFCQVVERKKEEITHLMNQNFQMFQSYENIFLDRENDDQSNFVTKQSQALVDFYKWGNQLWHDKVEEACQRTKLQIKKNLLIEDKTQMMKKIKQIVKKYLNIPFNNYLSDPNQNQRQKQLNHMYQSYWLSFQNRFYQEVCKSLNKLKQFKFQNLVLPGNLIPNLKIYLDQLARISKVHKLFEKSVPSIKRELILKINSWKVLIDSKLESFSANFSVYSLPTHMLNAIVKNQAQILQAVSMLQNKEFNSKTYVCEKLKQTLMEIKRNLNQKANSQMQRSIQLLRENQSQFLHPPILDGNTLFNCYQGINEISSISSQSDSSVYQLSVPSFIQTGIKWKLSDQISQYVLSLEKALSMLSKLKEIIGEIYFDQIPSQLANFTNPNLIESLCLYFKQIQKNVELAFQFHSSNRLIQNDSEDLGYQQYLITCYISVEKFRNISETCVAHLSFEVQLLLSKINSYLMYSLRPKECFSLNELNYCLKKFVSQIAHINLQLQIKEKQFYHQSDLENFQTKLLKHQIKKSFEENIHSILQKFIKRPLIESLIELLIHQENNEIQMSDQQNNRRKTEFLINEIVKTNQFSASKIAKQILELQKTIKILQNFSQLHIIRSIVYEKMDQFHLASKISYRLNSMANQFLDPDLIDRIQVRNLLTLQKQFKLLLTIQKHLDQLIKTHQNVIEEKNSNFYDHPEVLKLLNKKLKDQEQKFTKKLQVIKDQFQSSSNRDLALTSLSYILFDQDLNEERFDEELKQLFHNFFYTLGSEIRDSYYQSPTWKDKFSYIHLLSSSRKCMRIFQSSKYCGHQNMNVELRQEYSSFKETFSQFVILFCDQIDQIDKKLSNESFPVLKQNGHVYLQKNFKDMLVVLKKLELQMLCDQYKYFELEQSRIDQMSQLERSIDYSFFLQFDKLPLSQSESISSKSQNDSRQLSSQNKSNYIDEQQGHFEQIPPLTIQLFLIQQKVQKKLQQLMFQSQTIFSRMKNCDESYKMTERTKLTTEMEFNESQEIFQSRIYEDNQINSNLSQSILKFQHQHQKSTSHEFSFSLNTESMLHLKPQNKTIIHSVSTPNIEQFPQNYKFQEVILQFKTNNKGHFSCQLKTSSQAFFQLYQQLA